MIAHYIEILHCYQVGGQAVLGRQVQTATPWLTKRYGYTFKVGGEAGLGSQGRESTPWLTERHGYDPTLVTMLNFYIMSYQKLMMKILKIYLTTFKQLKRV